MGFPVALFVKEPHADLVCSICAEVLAQPVEAACGHMFCSECLSMWFQSCRERLCPSCRAPIVQVKSARVISNIIGDLAIRCSDDDGPCTWSGPVSELYRHREGCAHYHLKQDATAPPPSSALKSLLSTPPSDDVRPGHWLHLTFFCFTSALAGRYVALQDIVRMWAVMVLSLLGILEPGTALPIFSSCVFFTLDFLLIRFGATRAILAVLSFGWIFNIMAAVGTISLTTQRPVPPNLIISIGDMSVSMPIYYNIALTVISGTIGYYHTAGDGHKYAISCCALIVGVLLPFAVRLYRRRLPLDDLPPWRNGIDDLSLLYLFTTILSGIEFFNYCVFDSDRLLYTVLQGISTVAAMGGAMATVTEACLLGCATRYQVITAAMPLAALALACPEHL